MTLAKKKKTITANMTGQPDATDDFHEWKSLGQGGVPSTWDGYQLVLNAEKTIAFTDTLTPSIYSDPEKYASGWSKAPAGDKSQAGKPFLKEPLPERQSPRARAKRFVIPQRERVATDPQDLEIKQVSLCEDWMILDC